MTTNHRKVTFQVTLYEAELLDMIADREAWDAAVFACENCEDDSEMQRLEEEARDFKDALFLSEGRVAEATLEWWRTSNRRGKTSIAA